MIRRVILDPWELRNVSNYENSYMIHLNHFSKAPFLGSDGCNTVAHSIAINL